jgi:hypothetical protein
VHDKFKKSRALNPAEINMEECSQIYMVNWNQEALFSYEKS